MRVISQDGTIDVPYEQVVIQRFNRSIYFLNKNLTGVELVTDDMEMATYSTDAKAQKSMENLRKFYMTHTMVMFNKMACKVLSKEEATNIIGGVFQFPTEEELE